MPASRSRPGASSARCRRTRTPGSDMFDAEVVISGAGPAGAGLAARLHQLDPELARRTIVLDRARFPRPKPCGGGLTGHAFEALAALGIPLDVPAAAAATATVRFGDARREVPLPRPVSV